MFENILMKIIFSVHCLSIIQCMYELLTEVQLLLFIKKTIVWWQRFLCRYSLRNMKVISIFSYGVILILLYLLFYYQLLWSNITTTQNIILSGIL